MYLQTILKRAENQLTRRILLAQKADPSPGDFVNIVDSDLKKLNLNMDYKGIESMNKEFFKNMVKKKVKEAALKNLKELQYANSKIRNIKYPELQCQPFSLSSIFTNEDVNLLYSLRGL